VARAVDRRALRDRGAGLTGRVVAGATVGGGEADIPGVGAGELRAIAVLRAGLRRLEAAMSAEHRAVVDRRAQVAEAAAMADVDAVGLAHARLAGNAARPGLRHAVGVGRTGERGLDAALARVRRACGRRAGRDRRA